MYIKGQKQKTINIILCGLFIILGYLSQQTLALAQNPDPLTRAQVFIQHRQYQQAVSLYSMYLQSHPDDWSLRNQLMDLYILQGQTDQSQKLLTETQALYPDRIETKLLEARTLLGLLVTQGDAKREEAIIPQLSQLSHQASAQCPTEAGSRYLEGMVLLLQGNSLDGEEALLRALYQQPNHLESLQVLSDLYLNQHQPKLATPLIKQALELQPGNVDTLYLLGKLFLEKEDPEQALAYLKQSQEADPQERPQRLLLMAECYQLLGEKQLAMQTYQQILAYWPQRGDIWAEYARLANDFLSPDEAVYVWQRAYATQPTIINELIDHAESVFWNEGPQKALASYRQLSKIAPERPDLLLMVIDILYAQSLDGARPDSMLLNEQIDHLSLLSSHYDPPLPPLQLAQVELQWIRDNQWTPDMKLVTQTVSDQAQSPFVQAHAATLLNCPLKAIKAHQQAELPLDPKALAQHYILWGTGDWAVELANTAPELETFRPLVEEAAKIQADKANIALKLAQQLLAVNMTDKAQDPLNTARTHQFLSPNLYLNLVPFYQGKGQTQQAALAGYIAKLLAPQPPPPPPGKGKKKAKPAPEPVIPTPPSTDGCF